MLYASSVTARAWKLIMIGAEFDASESFCFSLMFVINVTTTSLEFLMSHVCFGFNSAQSLLTLWQHFSQNPNRKKSFNKTRKDFLCQNLNDNQVYEAISEHRYWWAHKTPDNKSTSQDPDKAIKWFIKFCINCKYHRHNRHDEQHFCFMTTGFGNLQGKFIKRWTQSCWLIRWPEVRR